SPDRAEQVANIGLLLRSHLVGAKPRVLAPIVRAHGLFRTAQGRPVEQQDEMLDTVRLDEKMGLPAQLPRAREFRATRREAPAATRYVKSVVLPDVERASEKRIGRLLKTTIGARGHENSRPLGVPRHSECERFH